MNPLNTVKWPLIIGFVLAVVIAALVDGGLTFNRLPWRRSRAGCTSSLECSGSACCTTSTRCRRLAWPLRPPTKAARGAPGSTNISLRAPCCGFVGRPWLPGCLGAWLLSQTPGRFVSAFTLSLLDHASSRPNLIMGIGAWLGTIMLFNVWGLIWPNQKKILGIVPATDEQKAKARKVALYASRIELLAVDPDADVHGRPDARIAVLNAGGTAADPQAAGAGSCRFAAAGRRGARGRCRRRRSYRRAHSGR